MAAMPPYATGSQIVRAVGERELVLAGLGDGELGPVAARPVRDEPHAVARRLHAQREAWSA